MERDNDLIELGSASAETRGPVAGLKDEFIGQTLPGLSDD
jgi:hypothetical protein